MEGAVGVALAAGGVGVATGAAGGVAVEGAAVTDVGDGLAVGAASGFAGAVPLGAGFDVSFSVISRDISCFSAAFKP